MTSLRFALPTTCVCITTIEYLTNCSHHRQSLHRSRLMGELLKWGEVGWSGDWEGPPCTSEHQRSPATPNVTDIANRYQRSPPVTIHHPPSTIPHNPPSTTNERPRSDRQTRHGDEMALTMSASRYMETREAQDALLLNIDHEVERWVGGW